MAIFKELRRRSKASFRTNTSSGDSKSNDDMTSGQSSSTLETVYSSSTPPSSIKPTLSTSNLQTLSETGSGLETPMQSPPPQRPVPITSQSNRNSFYAGNNSPASGSIRTPAPTSPYSPRIISVSDNSWVHQKVLLLYGQIGDPRQRPVDGTVTVYHHQDGFPATTWPVSDSNFKALVHLSPGPNRLRFDFTSSSQQSISSASSHSAWHNINCLPLTNTPPLDLVILLAKDSPGTFDTLPDRVQRKENGLDTAIRKYRMAAYLWQAFTGEQMFRHAFGRRCFRFEEEWQVGTLSKQDIKAGQMRNEAKIHVVRTDKTVAELRDLEIAQQHGPATKKQELFHIAMDAVTQHFQPNPEQKRYVSVLLLDSHWDAQSKVITGHAALGSHGDNIKLAIFGSHSLQSYPSCLEEVVPAFTDCTRTDTQYLANDCGEAGSNWESANIGIGAHLHEVGHLFGCPHQESGVMRRDYVHLNRTFTSREPFSTRTKSQGLKLCKPNDECQWHRLDALRFRFHPCFRLPSDPPFHHDESVQIWPVENGKLLITASSGVAFIEIYTEGDELCRHFMDFINSEAPNSSVPRQVAVTESELRQLLPPEKQKAKLRVDVFSGGLGKQTIDDVSNLKSKKSSIKLPKGQRGYSGSRLGASRMEGSEPQQILLDSAFMQNKLLTSIKVYHGTALDGLEFCYEDATSQLFGKRGGKAGGDEFIFDTRRGEILLGFYVRAGLWIDGIEILTSFGRKSGVYGNAKGGSGHTLIPPRGYSIAGLSGSCGSWMDGLSMIIMR